MKRVQATIEMIMIEAKRETGIGASDEAQDDYDDVYPCSHLMVCSLHDWKLSSYEKISTILFLNPEDM